MIEKNEEIIEKLVEYGDKYYKKQTENIPLIEIDKYIKFDKGTEIGSKNYSNKQYNNMIPYIRVGNLLNNSYDTFCNDDNYKQCDYNDILIAFDGAPGRNSIGLKGAYSSGIYKVKCNESIRGFAYFYINSALCQNTIKENSQGTTILHAGKSIKLLIIPNINQQNVLNNFNILFESIIAYKRKNTILKIIKSNLLAKYFD